MGQLFLLLLALLALNTSQLKGEEKKCVLRYSQPAPNGGLIGKLMHRGFPYDGDWEHWSLPIGNGYMGANIFGRTD